MTDQASVQTHPFICGIYGYNKCRRTIILYGELHLKKIIFICSKLSTGKVLCKSRKECIQKGRVFLLNVHVPSRRCNIICSNVRLYGGT